MRPFIEVDWMTLEQFYLLTGTESETVKYWRRTGDYRARCTKKLGKVIYASLLLFNQIISEYDDAA